MSWYKVLRPLSAHQGAEFPALMRTLLQLFSEVSCLSHEDRTKSLKAEMTGLLISTYLRCRDLSIVEPYDFSSIIVISFYRSILLVGFTNLATTIARCEFQYGSQHYFKLRNQIKANRLFKVLSKEKQIEFKGVILH